MSKSREALIVVKSPRAELGFGANFKDNAFPMLPPTGRVYFGELLQRHIPGFGNRRGGDNPIRFTTSGQLDRIAGWWLGAYELLGDDRGGNRNTSVTVHPSMVLIDHMLRRITADKGSYIAGTCTVPQQEVLEIDAHSEQIQPREYPQPQDAVVLLTAGQQGARLLDETVRPGSASALEIRQYLGEQVLVSLAAIKAEYLI